MQLAWWFVVAAVNAPGLAELDIQKNGIIVLKASTRYFKPGRAIRPERALDLLYLGPYMNLSRGSFSPCPRFGLSVEASGS